MQIITGKIGSGKTFEMIRQAVKQNLTIVCRFEEQKQEYVFLAKKYFSCNLKAIIYDQFLNDSRIYGRSGDEKFIIDDIEIFLKYVFQRRNVDGFVYNGTDITFTEKINDEFYKKNLDFY